MRTAVFDPLVAFLNGQKRLFLAPDGDLALLPFEVLPAGDGRHLIDEYRISYLSVGRDVLRYNAETTAQPLTPLVAADPNFDLGALKVPVPLANRAQRGRYSRDLDRDKLSFSRLPGTRLEGEQIATMLNVQPLLGEAVLEATLKGYRSPFILHIATHGFFLPDQRYDPNKEQFNLVTRGENPLLRSGLALSGANTWLRGANLPTEAEDGILTAEDVSGLDLLTTELTVLSACETGLGEVRAGEGVFGLRRAFMLAGTKTLIMSLWKVPDHETHELMTDFYRRILQGQHRADALREAQLAMKEKYTHPFFWGAFICQGNPGPLVQIATLSPSQ